MEFTDLPYVPLYNCLSLLDRDSLDKLQLMCRRMNILIARSHDRLAERKLEDVIIYKRQKLFGTNWGIVAENLVNTRTFAYDYTQEKNGSSSIAKSEESSEELDSAMNWLADILWNASISQLELGGTIFAPEELTDLNKIVKSNRTRVESVHIEDCMFTRENVDKMVELFTILQVKEMCFCHSSKISINELMTERFMGFISSLSSFEYFENSGAMFANRRNMHMSPQFYRFPPTFHFDEGLLVSSENLIKAINKWWEGSLEIIDWTLLVDDQLPDTRTALALLGKPFNFGPRGEMLLKNRKEETICVQIVHSLPSRYENSNVRCSRIHFREY